MNKQTLSMIIKAILSFALIVTAGVAVEVIYGGLNKEEAEKAYRLTILPNPVEATIKLVSENKPYYQDMLLKSGSYQIEVSHKSYKPYKQWVELKENLTLHITLEPKTFVLIVNTTPAEADIQIIGNDIAYHPGIKLAQNNYKILVTKTGFKPYEADIQLSQDISLDVFLQPQDYSLMLTTEPENANVTLLNHKNKYVKGMFLPKGEYIFEISALGYKTQQETIFLDKDTKTHIQLSSAEQYIEPNTGLTFTLVDDFYISTTEITNGQYRLFNPEHISKDFYTYDLNQEQQPVVWVNFDDANAYASWLSKKTGLSYRLPTEQEWEYAAKTNTIVHSYWGNESEKACEYANTYDKSADDAFEIPWEKYECQDKFAVSAPVASFAANKWQLYDMLGNVREWTCSSIDNNTCDQVPEMEARVVKGGSWFTVPKFVTVNYRYAYLPFTKNHHTGFRLIQEIE